jgi:hypothetical protein
LVEISQHLRGALVVIGDGWLQEAIEQQAQPLTHGIGHGQPAIGRSDRVVRQLVASLG